MDRIVGKMGEEEFGGLPTEVNDDNSRSIQTIVPHKLERVEKEQMAKQEGEEEDEERRVRGVELGRPRTPEPMSLGMPHLSEEDDRQSALPKAAICYQPTIPASRDALELTRIRSRAIEHVASAARYISPYRLVSRRFYSSSDMYLQSVSPLSCPPSVPHS